jgi:hypothetical protein
MNMLLRPWRYWSRSFLCFRSTWVHLMFPEHLGSPHVSGALEFASCFRSTWVRLMLSVFLCFPEHLSSPHVSGALEFASCCQWSSCYSICSFLWRVLWILFVHLSFSFCPSSIYDFRIPLNICFLLKILAHGIGHKLSQQLFKARSLIFKTNYIHDNNHTMKLNNVHEVVQKQAKMEKESNKETSVRVRNVCKNINKVEINNSLNIHKDLSPPTFYMY